MDCPCTISEHCRSVYPQQASQGRERSVMRGVFGYCKTDGRYPFPGMQHLHRMKLSHEAGCAVSIWTGRLEMLIRFEDANLLSPSRTICIPKPLLHDNSANEYRADKSYIVPNYSHNTNNPQQRRKISSTISGVPHTIKNTCPQDRRRPEEGIPYRVCMMGAKLGNVRAGPGICESVPCDPVRARFCLPSWVAARASSSSLISHIPSCDCEWP